MKNPEISINVDTNVYSAPNQSANHAKVEKLTNCKPDGFCVWCWLGLFCPLLTAFCLGRQMGDKFAWLKYAVPGILT